MGRENLLELRTRSVRRCLWKIDHQSIQHDLNREQAEMQNEYRTRYNFDFSKNEPLKGKYDWEPADSVPEGTTKKRRSKSSKTQTSSLSQSVKGAKQMPRKKRGKQRTSGTTGRKNIDRKSSDSREKREPPSSPDKKRPR